MKLTLTFMASVMLLTWNHAANATPDNTCHGNNIRKAFPSGAAWNICWTIADKEGLSLSQVYFKSPDSPERRILGAASLSQIQAGFDDGATNPVFITTQMGLGGSNAQTINQQACPGGELQAENGRNVLCTRTLQKGYLYKYTTQRQTEAFELSSYSQVGPRNYQIRWTFYENGTIEPAVGLSGIFPAVDGSAEQHGWPVGQNGEIATSFTDHYLWRLDFDLGTTHGNDSIQEISSTPSADRLKKYKSIDTLQTETAKQLNPANKTFWRVIDNSIPNPGIGPVSYEIVPAHYDQSGANSRNQSWLEYDMYFTRYNACERHMANNPTNGCSASVSDFVDNYQSITKTDVVAWYKQSNHYLPRSEDSNRLATRWSSFQLLPRDWNTSNPY